MFTDRYVARLPVTGRRYEVAERTGLRLRVTQAGRKVWCCFVRLPPQPDGRPGALRRLVLGYYPNLSLREARQRLAGIRARRAEGIVPSRREAALRERNITVAALAGEYIERWARPRKRTGERDRYLLGRYVLPHLGDRPAREVRRGDLALLLEALAARAPTTANRVLEVARRMFAWGVEVELLEHNPAAGLRRPAPVRARERVLDDAELASIWRVLHQEAPEGERMWPGPIVRAALVFALATAQRRAEIAAMRWDEIDGDWTWTIPPERTKNGRAHRVPLPSVARAVLARLARVRENAWVFPSRRAGAHIAPHALTRAVTRIRPFSGIEDWTLHDFRRTAASFMARAGVRHEVISRVLNHSPGRILGITGIYNRHSYEREVGEALERWNSHLTQALPPVGSAMPFVGTPEKVLSETVAL